VNIQELQGDLILTHCSSTSKAERLSVTLHLALPTPQKLLKSIKEWKRYVMFGVRGFSVQ
jgi:hypothetical protein